jgi:hypothetical protein
MGTNSAGQGRQGLPGGGASDPILKGSGPLGEAWGSKGRCYGVMGAGLVASFG